MRQIITMTEGSIVGINAATGASLWSIPFPDDWHENIVTPIWTGSSVIVSGPRQGTHAYSIARSAGVWCFTAGIRPLRSNYQWPEQHDQGMTLPWHHQIAKNEDRTLQASVA